MVSSLVSLVRPFPVHLVSHRPSIFRLYLYTDFSTCALFPVSYRALMFEVPILVFALVFKRVVGAQASLSQRHKLYWRGLFPCYFHIMLLRINIREIGILPRAGIEPTSSCILVRSANHYTIRDHHAGKVAVSRLA